jgi:hypothetical protein
MLLMVVAAALVYYWTRPAPVPQVSNYKQLTHDGEPKFLVGTDGSRLYLGVGALVAPGVAQESMQSCGVG